MSEEDNELSGDAKNYILLKKRGEIPSHIKDYGDWLAWKKRRANDEPEPEKPPATTFEKVLAVGSLFILAVFILAGISANFPAATPFIAGTLIVVPVVAFSVAFAIWFIGPPFQQDYNACAKLLRRPPFPTADAFWKDTIAPLRQKLDRDIPLEATCATVAKALYTRSVLSIYKIPDCLEQNAYALLLHRWWLERPQTVVDNARATIVDVLAAYCRNLPKWKPTGTKFGQVEVLDIIDAKKVVAIMIGHFFTDNAKRLKLFDTTRHQLNLNRVKLSTKMFGKAAEGEHGKRLPAEEFKGTAKECINAYLPDTLLEPLFNTTIPYYIPQKSRYEHVHIVAPSGHGKTHGALEAIITRDLEASAGMVAISPNDELLTQIAHVALLHDGDTHSVTFIDPADTPSLGIFDVHLRGDDLTVTQVLNEVSYFCETLIGAELTTPMSALINPLAQLMCLIPNANLSTFIAAIDDLSQFASDIERLPPRLREYLQAEMKSKTAGNTTRAAIKARLNSLLFKSPTFDRMFNATKNKVDVRAHINGGGVLLVNCNDTYGQEQAHLLGKYFISRTLQALLQREPNRAPPAYIYIDEAWMFLDKMVTNLLRQARKYNVGLVVCEPDMAHAEPGVHAGLGGVAVMLGAGQAATRMQMNKPNPALVASMRTRPPHSADFALFDRHRVRRPVRVQVPLFGLRKLPTISEADYKAYRKRNAAFLSSPPPRQSTPNEPDEGEW